MRTYVVFYKPSGRQQLGLVERVYRFFLRLYQGGTMTYHHAGLMVEFDDGEALVFHHTWDGVDCFPVKDLNDKYTIDKVEVFYDYDAVSNAFFWFKETAVRVNLLDAVRVFFGLQYRQPLCSDFVNGVLYRDEKLGYKHNTKPETPDELYASLVTDNGRTSNQPRLLASAS